MRGIYILFLSLFITTQAYASTAITGVTAITMDDGKVIPDATVVIDGDRIVAVGPTAAISLPKDTQFIDGTGKYLIPGMTEMHGHLPSATWSQQATEDTLFLYLAGGVTTVRGMLGHAVQFTMRDQITKGEIAGPTLYLAAPSLNGNTVTSPEQGRELVQQYAQDGWDLLKIHPGIKLAAYMAIADEANKLSIPFGGHVPQDVGIINALEAGQISLDHMDGYMAWLRGDEGPLTDEQIDKAVKLALSHGAWIVPTHPLFNLLRSGGDLDTLKAREENKYIPSETLKNWENAVERINLAANSNIAPNRDRLLKALADADAKIALGSDAPQIFSVPGFSIWREIESMSEIGLTPAQILKISTIAPGTYFRDKDTFGQIKPGARADLLLLDGDPRANVMMVTKQSGVMAAGRWYSRADIDARLADIADRNSKE
ncbi:imidazolonepropionase [Kordiimonas sediminis]|uniref:Imidazolonepropionase n=1 Tax=Kordiimonas sediminis TaxID=1735581 RepID=A0A919E8Z5_9PROT|nr:amidohydrolase family protein [Kordiimonas sediminis]GHF24831.1 imidazolonepropionase [Kordiimonas sediminis]